MMTERPTYAPGTLYFTLDDIQRLAEQILCTAVQCRNGEGLMVGAKPVISRGPVAAAAALKAVLPEFDIKVLP